MEETTAGGGVGLAFLLTLLSGISTGLGGVVVLLLGEPSVITVGYMEAFAAGVMIYLSIIELAWPAFLEIGFTISSIGFLVGGALFWGISLLPMPSVVSLSERLFESGNTSTTTMPATKKMLSINSIDEDESQSREGVNNTATENAERVYKGRKMAGVDEDNNNDVQTALRLEEEGEAPYSKDGEKVVPVLPFLRAALVTAMAISLHNFPEGVAVYLTSLKGIKIGLILALGIALHNIPEGMSVAAPIYFITKSKMWAVLLPLISGMFEPLGALMAGLFLFYFVTQAILQFLLACVAGVMCFLSFNELLPIAVKHSGVKKSLVALTIGVFACYFATSLVEGTSM